jgi:hypothetical protein
VTETTDVGTRYLELALRLRRLEPDLVECYTGPAWLADRVESEPPPTAEALQQDVAALRGGLHDAVAEPDRRAWLAAQLDGLKTALGHLGGERVPYRSLVRRCHGVDPGWAPRSSSAPPTTCLRASFPEAATSAGALNTGPRPSASRPSCCSTH